VACSTAAARKENRGAGGANKRVQELEKELNDQRVASARRVRALEARLQVNDGDLRAV
jgi:hypothetical protein